MTIPYYQQTNVSALRQRKKLARELIEIQATNWQSLLQYYTDDYVYQDPVVTIEGIDMTVQFLGKLFTSGPNITTTVEDEICINGIYMTTWTMSAVHGMCRKFQSKRMKS